MPPHTLVLGHPHSLSLIPINDDDTLDFGSERRVEVCADVVAITSFIPPLATVRAGTAKKYSCMEEGILLLTEQQDVILLGVHRDTNSIAAVFKASLRDPTSAPLETKPKIEVDDRCRCIAVHVYEGCLFFLFTSPNPEKPLGLEIQRCPFVFRPSETRLLDFGFLQIPHSTPTLLDACANVPTSRMRVAGDPMSAADADDLVSYIGQPPILACLSECPHRTGTQASRVINFLTIHEVSDEFINYIESGGSACEVAMDAP